MSFPFTSSRTAPSKRNSGLLIALLLTGCAATAPVADRHDGTPGSEPASAGKDAVALPPTAGSRSEPSQEVPTLALLRQSQQAAEGGDLDEAIAYVERAIRLNPRDPELWLRLAELQLSGNRPDSAAQVAQKAIALAAPGSDVQRRAWLVAADAIERQGDSEEAARIRQRWQTYKG